MLPYPKKGNGEVIFGQAFNIQGMVSIIGTMHPYYLYMSESLVTVTVKLFAAYQEAYGVPELVLKFPPQTPVSTVLNTLITQHPELEQWRNLTRFGINLEFVEPDAVVQDGDEVVLIPPVSGG